MYSGIDERRRWLCIAALVGIAAVGAGCPRESGLTDQAGQRRARVNSFADASPVRLIMAAPPFVFSASETGLDRWDVATGRSLELNAAHGLPGDRVEAMAFDEGRSWLWVATEGGMTRYDVKQGTFAELRPPPSILGIKSFAGASMTPASDGGLWIGHRRGLFYTNPSGQWTDTGITEPVSAVLRTRDGWLWIGAASGLIGRRPDGEALRFGAAESCDVAKVRFITEAPGGLPMVVGENAAGEQRVVLVFASTEMCASYRAAPDERWVAAVRRPDEVILLTSHRMYALSATSDRAPGHLRRDGMRLLPVAVGSDAPPPRTPYVIRSLDVALPARPQSIGVLDNDVFIGTQKLGMARLPMDGSTENRSWLRRGELVQDGHSLSVACSARNACLVATGGRHAWRYDGSAFSRVDVDGLRVLAFVRSPGGDMYALTRGADGARILLYQRTDASWTRVARVTIEVPGPQAHVRSARFAPGGRLWIGLAHGVGVDDLRSHGVAVVDVKRATVAYHRASADDRDVRAGVLPIPIGVVDIAFLDDDVWLATSEGAAQVRGKDVKVYGEHDGLRSEVIRGVAVSPGGIVFAATRRGIAAYDGEQWSFPEALRWPVHDVEMGQDGRLWMATGRGVAVYDGARVRRLDERRGLLQNDVEELRADHFGRIWARSSQGLTVITP